MITLYNIITTKQNGVYYSPYATRILLALKHKGLDFEHVGLTFTEVRNKIPELTDKKWNKIPVLVLEDKAVLYDSAKIVNYLEQQYPSAPLYPNNKYFASFIQEYINLNSAVARKVLLLDMVNLLQDENDKAYFRDKYESIIKMKLEDYHSKSDEVIQNISNIFAIFRIVLSNSKFLEGDQVSYSDYVLFSFVNSIRVTSPDVFDKIITKHQNPFPKLWFDSIKFLYSDLTPLFT